MARRALIALPLLLVAALGAAAVARADAMSDVAALQVALRAHGLYDGPVDGVAGPGTAEAVRKLQLRKKLTVDGVVGPRTRKALGRRGKPDLGSRLLGTGNIGWDVAELQFLLSSRGFPCGTFDGIFGSHTDAALRKFQRWAGLHVDGRAGPATLRALSAPPARIPYALASPMPSVAPADGFGPRGARFHTGLDFPAASGTRVGAAAAGTVMFAGWYDGYGLLVTIAHDPSVWTMYAHLSKANVAYGTRVSAGTQIGLVGATGSATGPHLHFEVRVRGAAVDPLPALQ